MDTKTPEKEKKEPAVETKHIVKMWTPCPFTVREDYTYFPKDPVFRLLNRSIRAVIYLIFPVIHKAALGLRVKGKQNLKKIKGTGAVLVCNHVHIIDCVIIACHTGKRSVCFPTIQSNFKIPVIRHLIRWLGAVPIPGTKKCFQKLAESLSEHVKSGGLVHFYPETVLHPYCEGLRGFKRGAFLLAAKAGVPVLPYVITYRKPEGLYKYFKKKPCLTLHILEPVWPDPTLGTREAAGMLKSEVFHRMEKIMNPPQ